MFCQWGFSTYQLTIFLKLTQSATQSKLVDANKWVKKFLAISCNIANEHFKYGRENCSKIFGSCWPRAEEMEKPLFHKTFYHTYYITCTFLDACDFIQTLALLATSCEWCGWVGLRVTTLKPEQKKFITLFFQLLKILIRFAVDKMKIV